MSVISAIRHVSPEGSTMLPFLMVNQTFTEIRLENQGLTKGDINHMISN